MNARKMEAEMIQLVLAWVMSNPQKEGLMRLCEYITRHDMADGMIIHPIVKITSILDAFWDPGNVGMMETWVRRNVLELARVAMKERPGAQRWNTNDLWDILQSPQKCGMQGDLNQMRNNAYRVLSTVHHVPVDTDIVCNRACIAVLLSQSGNAQKMSDALEWAESAYILRYTRMQIALEQLQQECARILKNSQNRGGAISNCNNRDVNLATMRARSAKKDKNVRQWGLTGDNKNSRPIFLKKIQERILIQNVCEGRHRE
ncbi:MAG: hypothetical protein KC736_02815 [Candidatus Moranbacteria bacterium]|nr:hypothetical protein [Candidatus Moranbacteria bacterium]